MITFQIVHAFTQSPFGGNPAAVVPLDTLWPNAAMQDVAMQFNLSETAFFAPTVDPHEFELRFFTPEVEIDLCGHATLATADTLFRQHPDWSEITFRTKAGPLRVTAREDGARVLDLPARPVARRRPDIDGSIFGYVEDIYEAPAGSNGSNLLVTFQSVEAVQACRPDMDRLAELPFFGVIITAPARDVDFVSRYFAPRAGVAEDPVTGSAHCTLGPFWAERFGETSLRAQQVSARKGDLTVVCEGDRVLLGGHAVTFASGEFALDLTAYVD